MRKSRIERSVRILRVEESSKWVLTCLEGPQQVERAHGLSVFGQSRTQSSVWLGSTLSSAYCNSFIFLFSKLEKRNRAQPDPGHAPIRNRKTRKVANAKVHNRCTNITQFNLTKLNLTQLSLTQLNLTQQNLTQLNLTQLNLTQQNLTQPNLTYPNLP